MTTNAAILGEVLESPGFSAALSLSTCDLTLFRRLIHSQWLTRIAQCHPALRERAESLGIGGYHELSGEIDHPKLWPKAQRILPQAAVEALKQTNLFRDLRAVFGDFTLAEGYHGRTHIAGLDEIYWRLVRPRAVNDVGALHADHWFHEMMHMGGKAFSASAFTLKVWLPIYCEPGRNGLLLVPNSHRREWKHSTQWVNGLPKPQFDDTADAILIPTPSGNMLIFHERTLHGGAINQGQSTRVSAEMTLVFESEKYLRQRLREFAVESH